MSTDLSVQAPARRAISRYESYRWMAGMVTKTAGKALLAPNPKRAVSRPSHVPIDRVVDCNMLLQDFGCLESDQLEAHDAWVSLRDRSPDLFWTPRNGGHWVATRAHLIEQIAMTPELFSSAEVVIPRAVKAMQLLPLEADPPNHQHYRNLVAPWFTPKEVSKRRDDIRSLAVGLIEELRPRGECEFVADFAKRFPIGIFLQLVDLPSEDREFLLGIVERALHSKNSLRAASAFLEMSNYVEAWIRRRRLKPGDDLLSALVNGEVMGRPLTHTEIQSFLTTILLGGLDTVAGMLSFIAKFLAENPGHRRQLQDNPGLIPNAVDEFMRRFGLVNLARVVTRDTEFDGLSLKKNEMVLMCGPLAGLDDRCVSKPMTVDFTRDPHSCRHAAFGMGIHRCVAATLGKVELQVFLEEWLTRIPEFGISAGQRSRAVPGLLNRVDRLPLFWPVS